MALSEVGTQIIELKARSGLTWAGLADALGASSGDYVRKVASGAKPGKNLIGVVGELLSSGEVAAPVARRTTRSGSVAKVRASKATGAPSRRPSQNVVTEATTRRRLYASTSGQKSLGWAQRTGPPETSLGTVGEFGKALRSARQGRKRRVTLRALVKPHAGAPAHWVTIGGKSGYVPKAIVDAIRTQGLSEEDWFIKQLEGRKYASGSIVDVEVLAE